MCHFKILSESLLAGRVSTCLANKSVYMYFFCTLEEPFTNLVQFCHFLLQKVLNNFAFFFFTEIFFFRLYLNHN